MIKTTTLTSKGQVTIPIEYRRSLGLRRGQKIKFGYTNGILAIQPLVGLISLIGSLRSSKKYSKKSARKVYLKKVLQGKI